MCGYLDIEYGERLEKLVREAMERREAVRYYIFSNYLFQHTSGDFKVQDQPLYDEGREKIIRDSINRQR